MKLILGLFHVEGDQVVSEGWPLLLWPISLALFIRKPETRTSPVFNAVFVTQIRIFGIELAQISVRSHWYSIQVAMRSQKYS